MTQSKDLEQIKAYFATRIREHGASPRGADWNGPDAQRARFDQILKVVERQPFSLLDFGCGYGGLAEYLTELGWRCDYYGYDILDSAIAVAQDHFRDQPSRWFTADRQGIPSCDYAVASGTFNFRGDRSAEDWTELVLEELGYFDRIARRGFACNFLTKYSDAERMRDDLYYADPLFLFDHCKRVFSKNVALLHDYRLYDFTLIVRKD